MASVWFSSPGRSAIACLDIRFVAFLSVPNLYTFTSHSHLNESLASYAMMLPETLCTMLVTVFSEIQPRTCQIPAAILVDEPGRFSDFDDDSLMMECRSVQETTVVKRLLLWSGLAASLYTDYL